MSPDDKNILGLESALSDAINYPRNDCGVELREHSSRALLDRLGERAVDIFGDEIRINIVDVPKDGQKPRCKTIDSATQLEEHLRLPIDQCTRDPKQRYIFLTAPHSRAPLRVTRQTLFQLLTYHQVAPSFLDFALPFGNQHYERDFYFGGFRSESHISAPCRTMVMPSLGRSGRHIDICYNLKSVEKSGDSTGTYRPWLIRQCSIYHRFDLSTHLSTWIVVKANGIIQDAVIKQLDQSRPLDRSGNDGNSAFTLSANLEVHRSIADWAGTAWHWYISDLEEDFQDRTRRTVDIPVEEKRASPCSKSVGSTPEFRPQKTRSWTLRSVTKTTDSSVTWSDSKPTLVSEKPRTFDNVSRQVMADQTLDTYSFKDTQSVQKMEDKANGALMVLKANSNVLKDLGEEYKALLLYDNLQLDQTCRAEILAFERHLASINKDMSMQQARLETLLRMIADRKSLLQGILQYRNVEASRILAEQAQQSALNMEYMTQQMHAIAQKTVVETVSMRIITVVTLFFLPGTFISTLMSTPIVNFDHDEPGFGGQNIGSGALKLYLVVSLPLMVLTFLGWYVVYWRERRRQTRLLEHHTPGAVQMV